MVLNLVQALPWRYIRKVLRPEVTSLFLCSSSLAHYIDQAYFCSDYVPVSKSHIVVPVVVWWRWCPPMVFWWWFPPCVPVVVPSGGVVHQSASGNHVSSYWCCWRPVQPDAHAFFDLELMLQLRPRARNPSGGSSSRRQHFVKKVSCKEVFIGALHGPSSCGSADMVYSQLARAVQLASGLLCLDPAAYAVLFHLL